jgi:Tol biopolymer transport system component
MHVMNADGSDVQELPSAGEYWDMSADYSPSGGKIVFVVGSEDYLPVLYTAKADGTERTVFDGCDVGLCSTHRNKPRWSPDGKKIVFQMWEYFSNDAQIHVKSADGGAAVQITRGGGRNFQPTWQPVVAAAP